MTQIAYTVIATISYKSKAEEWLDWLKNGHIDDVIKGGAESAEIVRLDHETEGQADTTYEIRYKFKDRGIFEEYIEKHAPALRQEGYEKFPSTDGFKYHRTTAEIIT